MCVRSASIFQQKNLCSASSLRFASKLTKMYKFVFIIASILPIALASHGYDGHGDGDHYEKEHYPPSPYKFGYDVKDGYGGTLNQKEEGDSHGNKKGSYGYTDAYGIYRHVDYIADKHGFRATVKTNEPGTANQNPADVYMHSSAGPGHYEGGHGDGYKSAAAYSVPSYAPVAEASYAPAIKMASPVYKIPISYAMPKAAYSDHYDYLPSSVASAYPSAPLYTEQQY